MSNSDLCEHLDQIQVDINTIDRLRGQQVCQTCVDMGDTWVNLRICMLCGHIGCCDDSKNRHATKHHQATGHPLIMDASSKAPWLYCYVDEVTMLT